MFIFGVTVVLYSFSYYDKFFDINSYKFFVRLHGEYNTS